MKTRTATMVGGALFWLASGAVALSFGDSLQKVLASDDGGHETCPADPPLSCSADAGTSDSCCYEGVNGVMLMTQLWDYDPAIGPEDLFTIHGLWPNKCKGGYDQFCNPGWKISDARKVLEEAGENELIKEMERIWKDLSGTDSDLWLHEFNKHGTCMSTLNPKCYSDGSDEHRNAVDYYRTTVELFKSLPTYEWLSDAGIAPSDNETFSVDEFSSALTQNLEGDEAVNAVNLLCDNQNALTQIYYHFKLKGAAAGGKYVPTKAVDQTTCRDGFYWLPKGSKGKRPPHKPGEGDRGHLVPKGHNGCLISNGKWYSAQSGSCATFTVSKAKFGGVEIKSSKGPCDVTKEGVFECKRNGNTGQFTKSGNSIVYGGNKLWSAEKEPTNIEQVAIHSGTEGGSIQFELEFQ